jgi:type I restriction enzyme S subunit
MLILTPGNFAIGGGFQLRPGKEKFYAGNVEPRYVLEPGELLVTMTDLSQDTATLGYPAIVPVIDGVRCLHNQRIGKVVLQDRASIDVRFLYYVLCSDDYREEIIASATGTAVKHTAPSRIEAYRFRVPPLSIQRNIAALLGSLDEKVDLNRRTSRSLDAMAQALFRSWFVDFDPVTAKREGRRPLGMDAMTADLFPSHFQESE